MSDDSELERLRERERRLALILDRLKHGPAPLSQEDVAAVKNTTRDSIRRIERRGIERMKRALIKHRLGLNS